MLKQPRHTDLPFTPLAVFLALGLIAMIGLFLRADSLSHWLANPDRYFFDEQTRPLLLGVDGYYYLDIARELREGGYQPFDPNRQVPRGFERSSTPPLLSVLTAGLARIFPAAPLEWIAILMPPVLGALLTIPAFLLGRALGQTLRLPWLAQAKGNSAANMMGLATAFFAVISPFLVSRGVIGWYETDPLNVFFATLLAFFALMCAEASSPRRALGWFTAWALGFLLFLWWWDQSEVPVLALAGIPMLVTLARVAIRSPRSLVPLVASLALLGLVLALWRGTDVLGPGQYLHKLTNLYSYIGSQETAIFRPAGEAVSEQKQVPLARLVRDTTGSWLPFGLALVGLATLIVALRVRGLYLTAIVLVSLLSFSGARFMIFVAPLFGLGMGFIAYIIWSLRWSRWRRAGLLGVLLVSTATTTITRAISYDTLAPRREPALFDAMLRLRELTPRDAVIWASWGHGHPLIHYTNRGTLGDGIYHPASLQYALNFPLVTPNPRLAANWAAFLVAHGVPGLEKANALFGDGVNDWSTGMPRLQRLLALGIAGARQSLSHSDELSDEDLEQRLEFLFPGPTRPTYLFLNELLLTEAWYLLGGWDFSKRSGAQAVYLPLYQLRRKEKGQFRAASRAGRIAIDLRQGRVRIRQNQGLLRRATVLERSRLQELNYDDGRQFSAHLIPEAGFGLYASENAADTLLTKLYFELDFDSRFFTPVLINLPAYSVWRVTGEAYRAPLQ